MIIYISGPMSGLADDNKPAFNAAAEYLRGLGHTVISPAEIEVPVPTYENYLKEDIRQMMGADVIVMLPGWSQSNGANLERYVAMAVRMPVKLIEEIEAAAESA